MTQDEKLKYMMLGGSIVAGLFLFGKTKKYMTYGALGLMAYKMYKGNKEITVDNISAELPTMLNPMNNVASIMSEINADAENII